MSAAPSASQALTAAASAPSLSKAEIAARLSGLKPGEEMEIGSGTFIKAFRIGAANPTSGGWHRAVATEGGFSVELPRPFNDLRIRGSLEKEHTEMRTFTVGMKTEGLQSWLASCVVRADGKFLKPSPEADALADGKAILRPIEPLGTPIKAYQRGIELNDRRCFMIVEAQGSDPLPSEADRKRFFESFKIEGKPSL